MSNRDIELLTELAKKKLGEKRTKEEALASLVSAGILTPQGNYTKPYKHLAKFMSAKK